MSDPGGRFGAMERCKSCDSPVLWPNFFDEEGYGNDGSTGDPWRTVCQTCGEFQDKVAPVKREPRSGEDLKMLKIIGLGHKAQTGKDAAAKLLEDYGYKRYAFADGIRGFALAIDPYVVSYIKEKDPEAVTGRLLDTAKGVHTGVRLSDLVYETGWEMAKQITEVRRILQEIGIKARLWFGDSVWVDIVMNDIEESDTLAVISDVRFPNEVKAIQKAGGKLYRLDRANKPAVNYHITETALDGFGGWDGVIENNGTLEDLQRTLISTFGLQ